MDQTPLNPKRSIIGRFKDWLKSNRAASQKRRSEYLYLSGDKRWQRLKINLHPESLFSFFTSRDGVWFVFKICVTLCLCLLLVITLAYFYYRREVPATIAELQSCVEGQTIEFYDRSERTLIYTLQEGAECERVQLDDISPHLIEALITIEDKDFFEHSGFKITSIARSFLNNLTGQPLQGGSTITQQYIKNAVLKDSDRSYERKIKEIILLPEIEGVYSKEDILTAYLNTIHFGGSYNGVEAASLGYFNKSASKLTLDEAALFVASIQAPNYIWNNPETHLARRNIVLNEMLKDEKITQAQYEKALKIDTLAKIIPQEDKKLKDLKTVIAPYFITEARKQLANLLCEDIDNCAELQAGGFKVITTINLKTQLQIEEIISQNIDQIEVANYNNAALIALDNKSKEVLGMVGGRDFNYPDFGQFNYISSPHTPGSLWHPLIYATLLENNSSWGAGRTFYDYSTFDFKQSDPFLGPVSFRKSLADSIPTPTVKAAYLAKPERINKVSTELNLGDQDCQKNCAIYQAQALDFEIKLDDLANAYSAFASGGQYQDISYIQKISSGYGKTIYEREVDTYEVFDPQNAYIINHILSKDAPKVDNLKNYSDLAVKTNFSNNFKNNTFIAYTPEITLGGYIGNPGLDNDDHVRDPQIIRSLQATLIEAFLEDSKDSNSSWTKPVELQSLQTDLRTGKIGGNGRADYYLDEFKFNSIPPQTPYQIDSITNKLATSCTPSLALKTLKTNALVAELPSDDPAYQSWMQPIWQNLGFILDNSIPSQEDDLHQCNDDLAKIDVEKNGDCQKTCRLTIKVRAGTHDLKSINISANTDEVAPFTKALTGRLDETIYEYVYNPDVGDLEIEVIDQALYSEKIVFEL